MITCEEEINEILKKILDNSNNNSKNLISPYGSNGKKYLYLYRLKKLNGGN